MASKCNLYCIEHNNRIKKSKLKNLSFPLHITSIAK